MKLKEMFKAMQEAQMKKFVDKEILGFKLRIYNHSANGNKNRSLYAYNFAKGKKHQIFIGKPDTIEEVEERINNYLSKQNKEKEKEKK